MIFDAVLSAIWRHQLHWEQTFKMAEYFPNYSESYLFELKEKSNKIKFCSEEFAYDDLATTNEWLGSDYRSRIIWNRP